MLKRISILLIALSIIACSKKEKLNYSKSTVNGVEIITNENRPADSSFKIEMKELFTIDGNSEDSTLFLYSINPTGIDFDSLGNLYLLDSKKQVIHKYDPQGKQLCTFAKHGRGPGEMVAAFALSIVQDSIFVYDLSASKINKFDKNGKFIEAITRSGNMIKFPKKYGKYMLDANAITGTSEEGTITTQTINLFDIHSKHIQTIFENELKGKQEVYDPNSDFGIACVIDNKSNFCRAENSQEQYMINIQDLHGNKTHIVRKNYKTLNYSQNELKKMQEDCIKWGYKTVKASKKPAIADLKIDKYNRLWVKPSTQSDDDKLVFDIFENYIFKNRVIISADSASSLDFKEKYIVITNRNKKIIKIYDYK